MAFGAFTEGTREWKMSVPPNVLGSISISINFSIGSISMGISISISISIGSISIGSISIGSISISIVLGSISMDTMCVRCKTNVLTVDTMWTVQDKCERTHESFGGDVGARC